MTLETYAMSTKTGGSVSALIAVSIARGSCCRTSAAPVGLCFAREGRTDYVIVESAQATEPEAFAARELAQFLERSTGAVFAVQTESKPRRAHAIYVGHTEFAHKQGIGYTGLGEEEWVVRSVGDNLVITGGRPRGTLYGVYEFLEDHVGCHWLDRRTEVVPSRPTLTLGELNIRAKPWFWKRWVSSPTGTPDDRWLFMIRNKNYRYGFRGRTDFFPHGAFYRLDGYPRKLHSFSYYVNAADWFESRPEYFSLNAAGKRVPAYDGSGPGQLCLTHPDVRRLTLEKLRDFISKDRTEAAQKGCPPPRVYMIGQNDKYHAHCQCENCQAIAVREGSESGPLIDFVNDIAAGIEKDYPKILIETLAYNLTSAPPKTIKPRHNVLVAWCDVYSKCDLVRPLKHPLNARNYQEIVGWGKVAPRLSIGDDYWTSLSYYSHFPTPYCIIQSLAPDLKLFADQGAESFFAEAAEYMEAGQQFVPLRFWLAYQLLVDPHQPAEPLIKIFMDGYYGAAAGKMHGYLRYLQRRIDEDAQFKMTRDAPHKLKYLDLDFFVTAGKLFDDAEALVEPDGLEAGHISDERFILDAALLFLWPWLARKLAPGVSMPFDHETVIGRFEKEWGSFVKGRYSRFYSHQKLALNKDGKLLSRMVGLFRDPKLPKQFRDLPSRDVADFNWLTFSQIRPRQKFVPDEDAAGRMTATSATRGAIQAAEKGGGAPEIGQDEQHRRPLLFGVTDGPTTTVKPEDIPQDGKYHLYRAGRVRIEEGTTAWALEGKRLGVNLDRLFVPGAEDPAVNDWDAYISLKLRGPAYVKGSKKPNGSWMDRVLLVRPQAGEEPGPEYLRHQLEEKRRAARRPRVRVPQCTKGAAGDPLRVDWKQAVRAGEWSTLKGQPTDRKVEARFAQDGEYLYVRLTEALDPKTLLTDPEIFAGDDWEFLFAAKRGQRPYRQMAINPEGKHVELAYGESRWTSGAKVVSGTGAGAWQVSLAFPLEHLLPGGAKPGQSVYLNIMRGGKELLAWSPTFTDKFHELAQLGEVVLE